MVTSRSFSTLPLAWWISLFCGVLDLGLLAAADPRASDERPSLVGEAKTTWKSKSTTRIDFDEALIEGKMKAPDGFLLQGRKQHSYRQMVELRSNFNAEILDSRFGVRAVGR